MCYLIKKQGIGLGRSIRLRLECFGSDDHDKLPAVYDADKETFHKERTMGVQAKEKKEKSIETQLKKTNLPIKYIGVVCFLIPFVNIVLLVTPASTRKPIPRDTFTNSTLSTPSFMPQVCLDVEPSPGLARPRNFLAHLE